MMKTKVAGTEINVGLYNNNSWKTTTSLLCFKLYIKDVKESCRWFTANDLFLASWIHDRAGLRRVNRQLCKSFALEHQTIKLPTICESILSTTPCFRLTHFTHWAQMSLCDIRSLKCHSCKAHDSNRPHKRWRNKFQKGRDTEAVSQIIRRCFKWKKQNHSPLQQ